MSSTLLIEIANRIKVFDEELKKELAKVRPDPFTISSYARHTLVIPKTRDKKQVNEFRKILTFVKIFQKRTSELRKDGVCIVTPISNTSKVLLKIWTNVSRGKKLMTKIGLIDSFTNDYRSRGRASYSKLYQYYLEVEEEFVDYCKKNKIEPLPLVELEEDEEPINTYKGPIDESKVKIGKGLYIKKPCDISCSDFEKQLFEIFKKKYPEYEKYRKMVDEINKFYIDKPEFKISFEPSFGWNESKTKVMKIGIRATNEKCNEDSDKRPELLEKNNLVLDSDVNGSVPRLNSSMNLGHWNDDERDMYEIIFHNCYPNEKFTEDARDALKTLLIRSYFEKSVATLGRDVWNSISHDGLDENEVKDEMAILDSAIKKSVGPIMYGSEIYYIEGCVYLSVLYDLLKMGHFVWFLYDGLYASGMMMNDLFKALVNETIKLFFNEFYKEYMENRGLIR